MGEHAEWEPSQRRGPWLRSWGEFTRCSSGQRESKVTPGPGVTYGDAGVGLEKEQVNRVDVMEIYSPPRITVHARKHGLEPGDALDLVTGYDFNRKKRGQR